MILGSVLRSEWSSLCRTLIYLVSSSEKGLKLTATADISSFESGRAVVHSLYREWLLFHCTAILSNRHVYFLDSWGCKRKSQKDIIGILRTGRRHPQYGNCWIRLDGRYWTLRHLRKGRRKIYYRVECSKKQVLVERYENSILCHSYTQVFTGL